MFKNKALGAIPMVIRDTNALDTDNDISHPGKQLPLVEPWSVDIHRSLFPEGFVPKPWVMTSRQKMRSPPPKVGGAVAPRAVDAIHQRGVAKAKAPSKRRESETALQSRKNSEAVLKRRQQREAELQQSRELLSGG